MMISTPKPSQRSSGCISLRIIPKVGQACFTPDGLESGLAGYGAADEARCWLVSRLAERAVRIVKEMED